MIKGLGLVLVAVAMCYAASAASAADLTIIVPSGPDGGAVRTAAQDYQASTGKKIQIVEAPYDDLLQKEMSACSARSGAYDMLQIDDPWFPLLVNHKCLERLSGYFQARGSDGPDSDFVGKSLALCRNPYSVGAFYCLPIVGNAELFFYNQKMLKDAGYTGPLNSWDDVLKAATDVTKKGDGRAFGYVLRGAQGEAVVADFLPIFWAFGGHMFNDKGAPTLDSPEAVAALKFFLELRDQAPAGLTGFDSEEVMNSLSQGQSAMEIFWPIFISRIENPSYSRVVGQISYSQIPSGKVTGRSMSGNWLFGISAMSVHKQAAFDFLMFATSPSEMRKEAANGSSPVRTSVFLDPDLLAKPQFRFFPVLLDALERSRPQPRQQHWAEIAEAFSIELDAALTNAKTPEAALAAANQRIQQIISH